MVYTGDLSQGFWLLLRQALLERRFVVISLQQIPLTYMYMYFSRPGDLVHKSLLIKEYQM